MIDLQCKDTESPGLGVNNYGAGSFGARWHNLTTNQVTIKRGISDYACNHVRVRIWVYK
jgi:hypothetical protein